MRRTLLSGILRCVCDSGRLMVGQPNYEAYVQHLAERHPHLQPMDAVAFFRERQSARFGEGGRGGFRCC